MRDLKREYPLVSVVVPVYNCEKYLNRCLKSIVEQTYSNLEIIVVDDGSKDDSGLICDAMAQEDNRIIVIHQNNCGPGQARNTALEFVNGEYLVYVDSDDYISTHYIQTIVEIAEKYHADIVEVGSIWMLPMSNRMRGNDGALTIFRGREELVKEYFSEHRKIQNTLWGRLFRWSTIRDIRFTEKSIGEDSEYSLKALSMSNMLVKYNKALYVYRAYHESITRNKLNSKHFDVVEISYRDMRYLESLDVEPESWNWIIKSFHNTLIALLERIAVEEQEDTFGLELNNARRVISEVAELAQRHGTELDNDLLEIIDAIRRWAVEYRKKNRVDMMVRRIKNLFNKYISLYKVKVKYEYFFQGECH